MNYRAVNGNDAKMAPNPHIAKSNGRFLLRGGLNREMGGWHWLGQYALLIVESTTHGSSIWQRQQLALWGTLNFAGGGGLSLPMFIFNLPARYFPAAREVRCLKLARHGNLEIRTSENKETDQANSYQPTTDY